MICASVYLLVFIRNLLVHLAEKILLLQPLNFGGDYPLRGGISWRCSRRRQFSREKGICHMTKTSITTSCACRPHGDQLAAVFFGFQRLASLRTSRRSSSLAGALGSNVPPYQPLRSECSGCFGLAMAATNIS